MFLRKAIKIFKAAFADWREDKASQIAAAVAYYSIISLAPLVIVILGIAAFVFGDDAAAGQISSQIEGLVGVRSARVIEDIIANANKPTTGIVSTIAAILILLLGASGGFSALQDGLNTIWEVEPKPGRGVIGIIKDRFLSLAMVLGVGLLVLALLVLSAALSAIGKYQAGILPLPSFVLEILNFIASAGVFTVLFALLYKLVPDVEIAWADVWIGAAITALLFTIGKLGIGFYLGRSAAGTAYGAAGSLIVLLIWIYYSAQIFFLGAEFTQVYANLYGSRIKPDQDAMSLAAQPPDQGKAKGSRQHQEVA